MRVISLFNRLPSRKALRRGLREWSRTDGLTWAFIFKVLLTALLALWLAYRLELPQPSTVLVTVFIVMQPQSGQVLAKSFYRILGTLVGLSVMVLIIALFAQERILLLASLAVWVGLCTAGAARYRDFRGYAFLLAGYTASLIGLPTTSHPENAFMQALWRVLEISLGICCSGMVSAVVLPQTTRTVLHNTLSLRFRDFARMAHDGLSGRLSTEQFEALAARFAAESVGFENLRSASAFEDPHLRQRSGRLASLGSRFMLLNTRFHALHQLLNRLQTRPYVLDTLAPCLDEITALLVPLRDRLPIEADAARLAQRLAERREPLMQSIRTAREQLTQAQLSVEDLLDFNTAAELLYRFADDLHGYASAYATLHGPRPAKTPEPESFTPIANRIAAAVTGLRSALVVGVLGLFWIETAWPSGDSCALAAVLISALSSTSSNPRRYCLQLSVGTLGGALAGFVLVFFVLPQVNGFALLFYALSPVFILGAFLITRPLWAGYGTGLMVWFCSAALPGNMPIYDASVFLNQYLAYLLAAFVAAVAAAVLMPPNRPWMWRRLEQDLRLRVVQAISGKLKGLSSGFDSGTRDLLNQAYVLSTGHTVVQRQFLRWMFLVLEVGHAIIELRHEQENLPNHPCYLESRAWRQAIRAMGRALIRLFIQPGPKHLERALRAVDYAINSAQDARIHQEPNAGHFDHSPLRRVCSYLHFIRTSLLDPNSPLARHQRGRLAERSARLDEL
ncbi:putative membrane protein YccC [Pseudomonas duriflava]|uniref:Putative membrane protein YccC n=1 Tax=Pseudomonas duriflava TaxID=459528 RepID=A0A562Q6C8_9PSED|nr:FUSC family protein [Pseudomonas duriflava]TWI52302.1 putative membrane protein YccC [Pseudomonas duriflava]